MKTVQYVIVERVLKLLSILALSLGGMGILAVMLNLLLVGKEFIFSSDQIFKFILLICSGIFIKWLLPIMNSQ